MKSCFCAGKPPASPPSTLQTSDSVLRFHRCPYCRLGDGDIFVNLEQAATLPRDTDVLIGADPNPSVVLFRRGFVGTNPCPHAVFLLIDIILASKKNSDVQHCFTWRHPWFDESDTDGLAKDFMWDVFEEADLFRENRRFPGPRPYRPCFPFRVLRPSRKVRYPHHADPRARITCEGWVICSVNGRGFCKELAKAARNENP